MDYRTDHFCKWRIHHSLINFFKTRAERILAFGLGIFLKMKDTEAIHLIQKDVSAQKAEHWLDLGCGSGFFTKALAKLLPDNSKITGVDSTQQVLPKSINNVQVEFLQANFTKEEVQLPQINGILMANSFHYVRDKATLIHKLERLFEDKKQFLIVEYNTQSANHWVPYPITFQNLKTLFLKLNYSKINKLGELKSVYGGTMYAALIQT